MCNVSVCTHPQVDLVFVLDASGSVKADNFDKMKDFVKNFLSDADVDGGSVRVGVNVYSTGSKIEFNLNEHDKKDDMFKAIDAIKYQAGWTNTASGLEKMRKKMFTFAAGDRPNVDNVAIVLTDGQSNINAKNTIPKADKARNEGIHIYAIGIGLSDTKELEGIANKPSRDNQFAIDDFDELDGLEKQVFAAVCGKINVVFVKYYLL